MFKKMSVRFILFFFSPQIISIYIKWFAHLYSSVFTEHCIAEKKLFNKKQNTDVELAFVL